ncbi:MAG: exopolysaccharide biosynthesis polyprenyl glycosylphosphotransferase [Nocardioides sp.]
MAGTQPQASVNWVRPRRGEDDYLVSGPEASPDTHTIITEGSRATRRHSAEAALLFEVAVVASVMTGIGWIRHTSTWVVTAALVLVLVTLYHSGRQVTRQGLPHLGRIVRDMAIPVALLAFAAQAGLIEPPVLQDTTMMIAAATGAAVLATVIRRQASGRVRVMLIGSAETIARAATQWAGSRRIEIVGALRLPVPGEDPDTTTESFGVPVVTGVEDLAQHVAVRRAELAVVLSGPGVDSKLMRRLSWSLEKSEASLALLSVLDCVAPHRLQTTQFAGTTLVHVAPGRPSVFVRGVKNAIDRLAALLLLLVLSPVILGLALLVRLESRGPGFFRQTRIGQNGKPFTMIKLRTMCAGAHGQRAGLADQNERDGGLFKMRKDPRVTRVGRVLRRTSLDELPQLFNVLRGEMALVGPRPALPEEVSLYDELARRRLAVRPGLTGLSQVSGRANLSYDNTIQLDVRYTDNWRLAEDIAISARTVRAVVSSKGAY